MVDLDRITRQRLENTTWRSDCEIFLRTERTVQAIRPPVGPEANLPGYAYPAPSSKNFVLPSDVTSKSPRQEYLDDLIEAMIAGLKGYFEKTGAFRRIGIALSGGKDSALTLVIAWLYAKRRFAERRELIKEFIHCFSMPTRFNSETTKRIAQGLCEELGVTFSEVPIEEQFTAGVALLRQMQGKGQQVPKIALQNVQARIRGAAMWNWTNAAQAMWLQTGNMSEKAVGYTTIGGDLMGAYSLLGNLPKTVVIELLRHIQESFQSPALAKVLETKASAELEENQEDEADLMPFPVLDACYALFVGEKMMPREVYQVIRNMWSDEELAELQPGYSPGMLKEWVAKFVRLFRASIFKWVQAPQAVHLGSLDLDRERALQLQLPVVQSSEWLMLEDLNSIPE